MQSGQTLCNFFFVYRDTASYYTKTLREDHTVAERHYVDKSTRHRLRIPQAGFFLTNAINPISMIYEKHFFCYNG